MNIQQVGFVGLGTMGAGMARQLARAGFTVVAYNRTRVRGEALVDAGVRLAETPRAAALGSTAVIVCVANDAAVEQVALGQPDGLVCGIERGALVIDCSTTGLVTTARIAAEVRARGGEFLDAPVTGSKLGAEGGKLTFMVGGPAAAFARARPLWEAMGKHAVHVGEAVGQGQAAKYCLNMSQAVILEGLLEGYTLAKALGVSVACMAELFENSAGKTGVGSFKTPYLRAGDYTPHFRLDLMHKDLHLALAEAERRRIPLPAASAVRTLYDQGVAEGLGPHDFLVLATMLERWAKVDLRD